MPGIDLNTKLIAHFDGNDGAKEIIDDGITSHVFTQVGTATLDTSVKKFKSSSLFLDGNSDIITTPGTADLNLQASDFTLEAQINFSSLPTAGNQYIIIQNREDGGANDAWRLSVNNSAGTYQVTFLDSSAIGVTFSVNIGFVPSTSTWYHLALVRNGSTFEVFLDGVSLGTNSSASSLTNLGASTFNIGGFNATVANFHGYIDELRVSDTARWTSAFTPETEEYDSDVNTILLLHMNSLDVSGDGGSGNYHIPTFFGTAQIDTTLKNFGTGSLKLDGNSDYITFPDSADFDVVASNADNWTIDLWMRTTSVVTGASYIVSQDANADQVDVWRLLLSTSQLQFSVRESSSTIITLTTPLSVISINTWHHIALVKKADEYGIYVDGVQEAYVQDSSTLNVTSPLYIGRNSGNEVHYFPGNLDELRIEKSNYFSASPNVGLSDTITVPVEAYSPPTATAPLNLTATAISGTEIDLDWDVPSDDGGFAITGYQIERESPEGGGFSVLVADTGNTNTDYSDTGLSVATEYNYRVSAINSSGVGAESDESKDTTDGKPDVPTNLNTNLVSDTEIDLSWDAPLDDGGFAITGYKIERKNRSDKSFEVLVADTGNTNTTYSDIDFIQTSKLIYRVSAINSVATSDPSSEHTTSNITYSIDASTTLLLHMDDSDFTDDSDNEYDSLINGTCTLDTVSPKFGTGNLHVETANSHLDFATLANVLRPPFSGDFSIDFWFKPASSSPSGVLCRYGANNDSSDESFSLDLSSGTLFVEQGRPGDTPSTRASASLAWDSSTWYHIALERYNDVLYIYRDGEIADSGSILGGTLPQTPADPDWSYAVWQFSILGSDPTGGVLNGRADEFRYSRTVSRYEGEEFCPPVSAYSSAVTPPQEDLRFNVFRGKHENVDSDADLTFDKFSGKHYKNYKKG